MKSHNSTCFLYALDSALSPQSAGLTIPAAFIGLSVCVLVSNTKLVRNIMRQQIASVWLGLEMDDIETNSQPYGVR